MSTLAKIRTQYGEGIGVEIFFQFPEISNNQRTYLDADSVAGVTSITADGVNFAQSQFVVIGQPGDIKTEIIQISPSTPPTSTSITFATQTTFAHNRGDIVRFIPYNQIVPERSTNAGVSYSALATIGIRADSSETYLQRPSDASTDYYRFRFFNSDTSLYSTYSDAVIASGYGDDTIYACKERALSSLGEKRSSLITDLFLNESIMEARRIADQNPAVFRWSFRTKFGVAMGQMLSGQWSITVPTDLRDRNTYKNILSLRFGKQNRPIVYQDRFRFNQNYLNVGHNTLNGAVTIGATSIVLNSTHDMDAAGAITVANNAVGDGLMVVSYTGNNKTTNTLTGVTGVTRNIADGTDVWQRAVFGLPTAYTIDNGKIYFDVAIKLDYDGEDVKTDYYQAIQPIHSDADRFDEPFYDLYTSYLKWKIKYLKSNGKIDRDSDTDFKDWQNGLGALIGQESPGQRINFIPDIEGFLSSVEG